MPSGGRGLLSGGSVCSPLPCRKLGVIVVREKIERGDYYRYRYDKQGEKAKTWAGGRGAQLAGKA